MQKLTVPIRGMHCRSCEILIEKNLNKINGVKKVDVDHKTGKAEVSYEGIKPNSVDINNAITEAGYTIGEKEKLSWFSSDIKDYNNLLWAAGILLLLYGFARWTGIFNLNVNTEKGGLFIVLLVGLVAGVSTCMALVGGLVLGLSARHAELHPEATAKEKFSPHIYFNLGRIGGYAILGGLIGLIGSALRPSSTFLGLITIVVGAVMIILGLKLIAVFPVLKDKTIALPKGLSKFFGLSREQKEYSRRGAIITGILTFFLPCGFTQAMQLYAVSSGSFFQGAAIMGLFALGTAPGLLSIGGLASAFKGKKSKIFFAAAGLAVIILGWYNIANASRLIFTGSSNNNQIISTGEEQVVRMTQNFDGYSPNVLTVQKGRPVRWIIDSKTTLSCASYIVMKKYGIGRPLQKGENTITFTPTETGEIPFSCSMGMYTGKFIVIDGPLNYTDDKAVALTNNSPIQKSGSCGFSGGGCGGCGGGAAVPSSNVSSDVDLTKAQIIKSTYTQINDISPNEFTVKKGLPVKWVITMNEPPTGCMRNLVISGLNVIQPMSQSGKTDVVFIPEQTGDYRVTCSMGIHRATIHVI